MILLLLPYIFTIYLILIRLLRYRRAEATERRYGSSAQKPLAAMTATEAQAIIAILAEREFPRIFASSVFFALFKTYGIPSISKLLVSTGQLQARHASKRAADTGLLLLEMVLNPPGSGRAIDAIARTNYLHDRYRRSGKITDADMLYTLSLFALEPGRWVERMEWRALGSVEQCAMGTFYKALGDAMGIPYTSLQSGDGVWRDGLQWIEELEDWSRRYEAEHLVPAESNRRLAEATLGILTDDLPMWSHKYAHAFVAVLIGQDLQQAMILPPPARGWTVFLNSFITVRRFLLRNLAPPRPYFLREQWLHPKLNPKTEKYNTIHWNGLPWYVNPTWENRWGPEAWVTWICGGVLPGDDKRYRPEGYSILSVGPTALEHKGAENMRTTQEKLHASRRGRCPFV